MRDGVLIEPAAQGRQVVAPVCCITRPSGQRSHCAWPVSACEWPVGHDTQAESVLAAVLYLPASHGAQRPVVPPELRYSPGAQTAMLTVIGGEGAPVADEKMTSARKWRAQSGRMGRFKQEGWRRTCEGWRH